MRGEMANLGVTITISNNEDVSTLLAEKLYGLMKDDLINSGTGVISEVCTIVQDYCISCSVKFSNLTVFSRNWQK